MLLMVSGSADLLAFDSLVVGGMHYEVVAVFWDCNDINYIIYSNNCIACCEKGCVVHLWLYNHILIGVNGNDEWYVY